MTPKLQRIAIDSPMGGLEILSSARGVCAVWFSEDSRDLQEILPRRLYDQSMVRGDPFDAGSALGDWFSGSRFRIETLPLDIQGTTFQAAVWTELRQIPWGRTLSYGQLARRIGRPRAARAIGAACGANPIPIIVPCHRVIGADGKLTGFSCGLERKRWLLDFEQPQA